MGRVQTNFRAQDFTGSGSKTAAAPAKKAPAKKAESKPENPNEVPEGTSEEVLAWVGKSARKARLAYTTEHDNGKPRTTVITALRKIIDDDKVARKAVAEKKERDSHVS